MASFYTVKDISKMLSISEETVRRWIRSGKLKSNMNSRKDGNFVYKSNFCRFLKQNPKYNHRYSKYKETSKMAEKNDVIASILGNIFLDSETKDYLVDLVKKEGCSFKRNKIEEGTIVRAEGPYMDRRVLVVVKILNEIRTDYDIWDDIVIVYDFLAKEIDWRGMNLLANPEWCEVIGKMDPKQIFREDIKV